eukprot:1773463-Pyramimonas_sp.AAC.1
MRGVGGGGRGEGRVGRNCEGEAPGQRRRAACLGPASLRTHRLIETRTPLKQRRKNGQVQTIDYKFARPPRLGHILRPTN